MINSNYYLNQEFQDKVRFYLIKAAIAVIAEDESVTNHIDRIAYAAKVLNNSISVSTYALGVTTNVTIKTKIDAGEDYDNDLEFVVNSLFSAYATPM